MGKSAIVVGLFCYMYIHMHTHSVIDCGEVGLLHQFLSLEKYSECVCHCISLKIEIGEGDPLHCNRSLNEYACVYTKRAHARQVAMKFVRT